MQNAYISLLGPVQIIGVRFRAILLNADKNGKIRVF